MLELLEQLFRQVRQYALSEHIDRGRVYAESPKHVTMQFDHDAEDIIIEGLEQSRHGFEVITEERPIFQTTSEPAYRIIIDPIDGSENFSRGIMTASLALAVLPIDAAVTPDQVRWALVGELFSGSVFVAQQGRGAFFNGKRCQVSTITSLNRCLAGFNMDGRNQVSIQALLLDEPHLGKVRRTGSSAIDSAYVANGAYDAYIDVGGVLTGESFLASASIVLEAGGIVSDHQGQPLRPIQSLTDCYSIVMAGTRKLHDEIIARLKGRA